MRYNIQNYTEEQIQAALDAADIDTAIELWKAKDWQLYSRVRDTLVAMLRAGRGDELKLPQIQFIYFMNTHLQRHFSYYLPDWKVFTRDLPRGQSIGDAAWTRATKGDFFSEVL
jgi:hypothetical protein